MSEESEGELVHLDLGLREFSGSEPKCPMCGWLLPLAAWHEKVVMTYGEMYPCYEWVQQGKLTGQVGPHLCRRCEHCGYGWPEKTREG